MDMLKILMVLLFVKTMRCAPNQNQPQVIRYEVDSDHMPNSYNYHYETSDGAYKTEQGDHVRYGGSNPEDEKQQTALHVLGETKWITDDGVTYLMTYKAGPRGYRTTIKRLNMF